MDGSMNDTSSGIQPLLPTIENTSTRSCTNAPLIARARAQLASRMMVNPNTSSHSQDTEMVRPNDGSNPTDNKLGMKESQRLVGNGNTTIAIESLETQLSGHSAEVHEQNRDSLFCSPGPDRNIGHPNRINESPSPPTVREHATVEEQGEQSNIEPFISRVDNESETPRKRKRMNGHLLSFAEVEEIALSGYSTFCQLETKNSNASQSHEENGKNTKRKSKSTLKKWQNKDPTLSSLGSSSGIQHAKANSTKPEIPSFTLKNKKKALNEIIANLSPENVKDALSDWQSIYAAAGKFAKRPKPGEHGGLIHPNLNTSLFHYQLLGAGFMRDRERSELPPFGGFLCDEMGFGKTIQAIANTVDSRDDPHETDNITLVVAPSHLTKHWMDQFARHSKTEKMGDVIEYHARSRTATLHPVRFFGRCEVVVTTYSEVRMSIPKRSPPPEITQECQMREWWVQFFKKNCGPLHRVKFRRIILDEGHEIRNHASRTSVAVCMLSGHFRWVISGTPLHNGPHELFAYFQFLRIPLENDYKQFFKECINEHNFEDPSINRLLRTCMLKRGHDETLFGLPILKLPVVKEHKFFVTFSAPERILYQNVIAIFLEDHDGEFSLTSYQELRHTFAMLTKLRMFTSHILLAQATLKEFLTVSMVQSLRASINEHSDRVDMQICDLLEDLAKRQELWGNDQRKSQENPADKTPKAQGPVPHRLVRDLADKLKSPDEDQNMTYCIRCGNPPTSAYITSCLHIYCRNCARESMLDIGSVCECGAAVNQTTVLNSMSTLIANTHSTPCLEANLDLMVKARTKSMKISGNKNPNVHNNRDVGVGIDWLDSVPQIMPAAKLMATKSCLERWLKGSAHTKVSEGWGYETHTGEKSIPQRARGIQRFSKDRTIPILICSMKTGATGLDLTGANKCIVLDLWWSEAVEQQAFFRLFRINQQRDVEFVRIMVKNSIDDRLQLIQTSKTKKIEKVTGSKVLMSPETLANAHLRTIFGVAQDDNAEAGYRYLSDEEAGVDDATGQLGTLDNDAGKDSEQFEGLETKLAEGNESFSVSGAPPANSAVGPGIPMACDYVESPGNS